MRAGRLRHRVEIQRQTNTIVDGEQVGDWTTYARVWAGIEPINGREKLQSDAIQQDISHRIVLRYLADLSPKHRIKFDNRIFDINSVVNAAERDVSMELLCTEAL
jgi:SPP1 family predicted phage head-tail adaptor